jgi:purine-binding chemotaxis protein CheW
MQMGTRRFATFYLDRLFFGIEVEQVQEVIRHLDMTHVPLASSTIRGLINLRGQIVTAIDLRERLELEPRTSDAQPLNVVVRTDDGALSLLVDEIGDVLEIDDATFEQPPETIRGVARELIHGVYKLKRELLLVLDTARALQFDGIDDDTGPAAAKRSVTQRTRANDARGEARP